MSELTKEELAEVIRGGPLKEQPFRIENEIRPAPVDAINEEDPNLDARIVPSEDVLRKAEIVVAMPRYRCFKEVRALKIASVYGGPTQEDPLSYRAGFITPADTRFGLFKVSADYMRKHQPEPGGYYVLYADGYESFSPAKAFEDGYVMIDESGNAVPDKPSPSSSEAVEQQK